MEDKPLVDKEYLLKRFSGKGGWTYAEISEIPRSDMPFGVVKVKGTIDSYEIKCYTLMPMGNGNLLLAIKADIRKLIGKEAGDYVHIKLFADNSAFEIPEEFKQHLEDEPGALKAFISRKRWEQKMCCDWIFSAKREETKRERIIKTLYRLKRGEKIV